MTRPKVEHLARPLTCTARAASGRAIGPGRRWRALVQGSASRPDHPSVASQPGLTRLPQGDLRRRPSEAKPAAMTRQASAVGLPAPGVEPPSDRPFFKNPFRRAVRGTSAGPWPIRGRRPAVRVRQCAGSMPEASAEGVPARTPSPRSRPCGSLRSLPTRPAGVGWTEPKAEGQAPSKARPALTGVAEQGLDRARNGTNLPKEPDLRAWR